MRIYGGEKRIYGGAARNNLNQTIESDGQWMSPECFTQGPNKDSIFKRLLLPAPLYLLLSPP